MQVLCNRSSEAAEVSCGVCGQGFALEWEGQTKPERAQARREIAKILRSHHYNVAGPEAHPQRGFLVPERNETATVSAAAVLGNAPRWAL